MDDDWFDLTDPLDPLNPLHALYWSRWDCPVCAGDGDADELADGRCLYCGAEVDLLE